MDKRRDARSSSDEYDKSEMHSKNSDETVHSVLLEDEIKKIISGLDVKFDDSPPGDDGTGSSSAGTLSLPFPNPHAVAGLESEMSSINLHKRLESNSTVSGATTVVQQNRVPLKIVESHVQSCRSYPDGDPNSMATDSREQSNRAQRTDTTEPTSEAPLSSMDNSTATYGATSSSRDPLSKSQPNQKCRSPPQDEPIRSYPRITMHHPPTVNTVRPGSNPNLPIYATHPFPDPNKCPYSINNALEAESDVPRFAPNPYAAHPHQNPRNSHSQHPQPVKEKVDRYNSTHMTYSNVKRNEKPRRSLTDYFLSKSRNIFNRREESECSEIVPQLYKASIRKGVTPQRFTFKAVTGSNYPCLVPSDSITSYCNPELARYSNPCLPESEKPLATSIDCDNYGNVKCLCCSGEDNLKKCRQKKSLSNNIYEEGDGIQAKAYFQDLGCGYISQNSVPEKVDIYCFDQLNTGFFRTSDHPPPLFADIAIQRTERFATSFWAEIFGVINIFTAFVIAMILQTFKFLLQGIIRPLMIGMVQLLSDYLIKPLLTLMYNGFTQPISIFLYNVIASLRDVMQPLAKGFGYFFELIALVLRAIRIVEVRNVTNISPGTTPALKC